MTLLNLMLCYYTYKLDDASLWLCILFTPFGKYRHLCLPMGMMQSPNWAQAILKEIFSNLLHDAVKCYIDDISLFMPSSASNPWDHHLQVLPDVLSRLQDNGFTMNPAKCKWAVQEAEWLRHWITPDGICPLKSKVEGVLALVPPCMLCQLCSFIRLINVYCEFWRK